jgi:hypothetical protein
MIRDKRAGGLSYHEFLFEAHEDIGLWSALHVLWCHTSTWDGQILLCNLSRLGHVEWRHGDGEMPLTSTHWAETSFETLSLFSSKFGS